MESGGTKFDFQDYLYKFPYHYLPSLDTGLVFRLHRQLTWGLDYMTYMSFVAKLISQNSPISLCDVGCGDGRLINMVKPFVSRLTGIDLSERAVAFARAFNPEVEILCNDIASSSRTYAWVTLIEVIEHIPNSQVAGFVENVAHLVQADGHLLISVPTTNVPLNKKHYRHYSLEFLEDTLKSHFEIERYWWLYRQSYIERLIRVVLCNRIYLLNFAPLLRLAWKIHRRLTYFADASTGSHLVAIAKPKNGDRC
ncbi:class I SAM-dependent methyltransferase [bacterium]|nr:class I SAM-dependent methyltransferase [bacterium]